MCDSPLLSVMTLAGSRSKPMTREAGVDEGQRQGEADVPLPDYPDDRFAGLDAGE